MNNKLPVKWRIFGVVSYLHLTLVSLATCVTIYFTLADLVSGIMDLGTTALVLLIVLIYGGVLITNTCINLYLLGKCYPDKSAKKSLYDAHVVMFIISWFLLLVWLVTWSYLLYKFSHKYPYINLALRQIIAHAAVAGIILSGFIMLIMQPRLRKTIIRNHASSIDSFLNTES